MMRESALLTPYASKAAERLAIISRAEELACRTPGRGMTPRQTRYHPGMQSRVLAVPLTLVACFVVSGCGDGCGRAKSTATRVEDAGPAAGAGLEGLRIHNIHATTRPRSDRKLPPLPLLKQVRLDDPGKTPRRALRYRPTATSQRSVAISAQVAAREFKGGAWTERLALPEVRYGFELSLDTSRPDTSRKTDSSASSSIDFYLRGLSAGMGKPTQDDPKVAEKASLRAERGLGRFRDHLERRRLAVSISDRGVFTALTLSGDLLGNPDARGTRLQVRQLLSEALVPLPEEPVGVGARWTAITVLRRDSSTVSQRAEYEVVAMDGNSLQINAQLTQVGQRQPIEDPALPADVSVELLALSWRAKGTLNVDLDWITPTGTLDVEMRVHHRVSSGGTRVDSYVDTIGEVTLGPGASGSASSGASGSASPEGSGDGAPGGDGGAGNQPSPGGP